jgi:phosphorylase kinase alpha/beta subunit
MTRGEKLFQDRVEHILNKIPESDSRQLYTEALQVLMVVMWKNPKLRIADTLFLDVIIGHAVRLAWEENNHQQHLNYDEHRAEAWKDFYLSPPSVVANHFMNALAYLLNSDAKESA